MLDVIDEMLKLDQFYKEMHIILLVKFPLPLDHGKYQGYAQDHLSNHKHDDVLH